VLTDDFRVVLHVGLPKTGTTAFQQNILPYLDANVIVQRSNLFNYRFSMDRVNIISHEQFCIGFPHIIKSTGRVVEMTETLQVLFPAAKILFSVRDPEMWLRSCHKHAVASRVFTRGFDEYVRRFHGWELVEFFWNEYVELLRERFPCGVLVFDRRDLEKNPEGLVRDLCRFIDIPVPCIPSDVLRHQKNVSCDDHGLWLKMFGVRIFPFNIPYIRRLAMQEWRKRRGSKRNLGWSNYEDREDNEM